MNPRKSLKISIIGYGRMGKLIEEVATARGHKISSIFDIDSPLKSPSDIEKPDVFIDFSLGDAVPGNIKIALEAGVNIVVGATGWDNSFLAEQGDELGSAVFVASNMSIGVNLFTLIVQRASELLDKTHSYDVSIHEIHHSAKIDSPSGTALNLATGILSGFSTKNEIIAGNPEGKIPDEALQVTSERIGNVTGIHEVRFESSEDSITLRHDMKDRKAFAVGAVTVAEWLDGKKGYFDFEDYLSDVYFSRGE